MYMYSKTPYDYGEDIKFGHIINKEMPCYDNWQK